MHKAARVMLTAMTVGAVAAVGIAAAAVAMVPGDSAGEVQSIPAIAATSQTPSEGAAQHAVTDGDGPIAVQVPRPVQLGGAPGAPRSGDSSTGPAPAGSTSDEPATPGDGSAGTAPVPSDPPKPGGGPGSGPGNDDPGKDDGGPKKPGKDDKGPKKPGNDDKGPKKPGNDDKGPKKPGNDDKGPKKPGDDGNSGHGNHGDKSGKDD